MKIIDLLNKIAKGEEVPNRIKFGENEYEYYERTEGLFNFKEIDTGEYFTDDWFVESVLNDEVEEVEEDEFEDIKDFGISYNLGFVNYEDTEILKECLNKDFQTIYDTLDLLIKNQKKIIEQLKNK